MIMKQRVINGRITTYYKLTGIGYNFTSALDWCHGLGGQLPIILTEKELDFLADKVIVKDDEAGTGAIITWMGLKKEKGHCSHWLDKTPVNMTFSYDSTCESCPHSCCAMNMLNLGPFHKKMGFYSCSSTSKAVCVVDEEKTRVLPEKVAYLTKLYVELNGSLQDLSQKTCNNFDQVKLNAREFQSLSMKEHNELKKTLGETRHKLSETENKLKKLQTWIDDNVNIKEIESLKKSSSTSNILHGITLGMIGCLAVILGVIGYRIRRNSLPVTQETSVAYVAGEEMLNFSSAESSSPP